MQQQVVHLASRGAQTDNMRSVIGQNDVLRCEERHCIAFMLVLHNLCLFPALTAQTLAPWVQCMPGNTNHQHDVHKLTCFFSLKLASRKMEANTGLTNTLYKLIPNNSARHFFLALSFFSLSLFEFVFFAEIHMHINGITI